MKRLAPFAIFLVLFVACGDGNAPASSTAEDGNTSGSGSDSGDGNSIVTIGDKRFKFRIASLNCIGGGRAEFSANGYASDDSGLIMEIYIPPENWESLPATEGWHAPEIQLRNDTNTESTVAGGDWVEKTLTSAGLGLEQSRVESFSRSQRGVSGRATFIDGHALLRYQQGTVNTPPASVTGTFDINCED